MDEDEVSYVKNHLKIYNKETFAFYGISRLQYNPVRNWAWDWNSRGSLPAGVNDPLWLIC